MKLKSEAVIQVQKPIGEVYEAIVNPQQMTQYFIAKSTGRLETGKEVKWKFPEFPDYYPITDIEVETNRSVSFVWDPDTVVTLSLEVYTTSSTIVKVTEGDKDYTEENLKWLTSNTGGWANYLACLKAYLEYGINLRNGAYDFMRKT